MLARHLQLSEAQAERRGFDMNRLGFRAELFAASISAIWKREAQAVAVESLGKLAQALDTLEYPFVIGDLFIWDDRRPKPAMELASSTSMSNHGF